MRGDRGEERAPSDFMSWLSHVRVIVSLPASPVPDVKGVYDPTPVPPRRVWASQSKWLKSHTCWVLKHIIFPSTLRASKGKELVRARKRDLWIPLCAEHHECFFLNKLVLWCRDFVVLRRGWGSTAAPWKDHCSHLDFLGTVTPLNVISPLLYSWLVCRGPLFSFPVCVQYMAHSSSRILLVLSHRLGGVRSLQVAIPSL